METAEVLHVENLTKTFLQKRSLLNSLRRTEAKRLKAVDEVSFSIHKGETLGLVGESGCGKSTLAKCLMCLYKPDKGAITLNGQCLTSLKGKELLAVRPQFQMIFQDPYSSLNPRMTIYQIIEEELKVHHMVPAEAIPDRIREVLGKCGLTMDLSGRYPGEFSGGQQQRAGIARAIALNPSFLVADEPVSALDVSIQAQILNLLVSLQAELGQTMLFISHDLNVIRYMADNVLVMYLGRVMEYGPTEEIFLRCAHPYTNVLMAASPKLDPRQRKKTYAIEGEPPSPVDLPSGCRFHTRCPYCTSVCKEVEPGLKEIGKGHKCACHNPLS